MKKFIAPTYTFTPGASGVGTLNLSGIANFNVKNLVAVINQTRGSLIYSTASTTLKYSSVAGTTLTLFADTTGQSGSDVLQVIYEVEESVLLASTIDTSSTNIPASASTTLTITSGLPNRLTKISWSDEIGELVGVYSGASGSEVLLGVFSFGGGEIPVDVAPNIRISVRNMKNAAITSGYATIHLIG